MKSKEKPQNQKQKIKRSTAPKYGYLLWRTALPAMLVTWLLCAVATGAFADFIYKKEAKMLDSTRVTTEYMLNRQNGEYSALKEENGMSYPEYRKSISFYLRYDGTATILCDASGNLIDSSQEKSFAYWNNTIYSMLSCDTEMDEAYYDFADTYLNSQGKYFIYLTQMYVNWDTWEFIPKQMFLSEYFFRNITEIPEDAVLVYETTITPGEGFTLISRTDENMDRINILFAGTETNAHSEDAGMQAWYDNRADALADLSATYPYELDSVTTYASDASLGLRLRTYIADFLTTRDAKIIHTVPVSLFDENGSLELYYLTQERRYNLYDSYGTAIFGAWALITVLAFGICALAAYLRYHKQKNRWLMESYRRNLTDTMAHDLKSPLMVISGYAENLKDSVHSEKRNYYTEEILKCVAYMNDIIADMLTLGRLEQCRVTPVREAVALDALISELSARYQSLMDAKGLSFSLQGSHTLQADSKMLFRAFDNLFSNAVKYTPEGNHIQAVITPDAITITNTGVSLSKEMCRRAFEPFAKEDAARNGQKGNGIGLTIAREIFDLHDMKCRMESSEESVSVIVKWK